MFFFCSVIPRRTNSFQFLLCWIERVHLCMYVNKDATRDSSQFLFELSKFKICYDQDKNCHAISQEATQKNLIKMHKRTNSEDKNDIHILYLYWLKPLLKIVRARVWTPFITADGVFVLSRSTATVIGFRKKENTGRVSLGCIQYLIYLSPLYVFSFISSTQEKIPTYRKNTTLRKSRWEKQL